MSEAQSTKTKLNFGRLADVKAPERRLLAAGTMFAKIADVNTKPSSNQKPMFNWILTVPPADTVLFTDGMPLDTDYTLYHSYSGQATEKYNPDSFLRDIAEAVNPELLDKPDLTVEDFLNSWVKVTVKVSPARTDPKTNKEYKERNEITKFERCSPEELAALMQG